MQLLSAVPKQRNTSRENKKSTAWEAPEGWDENLDRLQQKDLDCSDGSRRMVPTTNGHKNNICKSMLTMDFIAGMQLHQPIFHDSQMLHGLP